MLGKIVQLKHVVFGITSNTHQQQYGCWSFGCFWGKWRVRRSWLWILIDCRCVNILLLIVECYLYESSEAAYAQHIFAIILINIIIHSDMPFIVGWVFKTNYYHLLLQSSGAVCESRGGRPGLPVCNHPYGLCGRKATLNLNCSISELRSCVTVEMAILGSPSLMVLMVSVDVKQHWTWTVVFQSLGAAWQLRWPSWAPRPWWSLWSLWT